jgi:hypothetical protein
VAAVTIGVSLRLGGKSVRFVKVGLSGKELEEPCENPNKNHVFNVFGYCMKMGPQGIVS